MRHRADDLGIFHQANSVSVCSLRADGKVLPHERSPHCLLNMIAMYNTLEEKLVDFVSACHRYMYVCVHDVIRFNVQCSPTLTPTFYAHGHVRISACPGYKRIDPYHHKCMHALINQTIRYTATKDWERAPCLQLIRFNHVLANSISYFLIYAFHSTNRKALSGGE